MSLEHPDMSDLYENSSTGLSALMQIQLAEKHGEAFDSFVERHAEDFRNLITAHPDLLEKFERDPDATLAEVEGMIYH